MVFFSLMDFSQCSYLFRRRDVSVYIQRGWVPVMYFVPRGQQLRVTRCCMTLARSPFTNNSMLLQATTWRDPISLSVQLQPTAQEQCQQKHEATALVLILRQSLCSKTSL